jgi:septum formation protein
MAPLTGPPRKTVHGKPDIAASAIYLASRSPRRGELLRQIGVEFAVLRLREAAGREPDIVEGPLAGEDGRRYVMRIARTKASTARDRLAQRGWPPRIVLAADTEVILDGEIFGKPTDATHAAAMLARLGGRTHRVVSVVAACRERRVHIAMSTSNVTMRALTSVEIARYVASGEPFGKAGGYAIQGAAAAFVTRLAGSYSGVMGLPLAETARLLAELGLTVL